MRDLPRDRPAGHPDGRKWRGVPCQTTREAGWLPSWWWGCCTCRWPATA